MADDKRKKNPPAQKKTPQTRIGDAFNKIVVEPGQKLLDKTVTLGNQTATKTREIVGKGKQVLDEKVIPKVQEVGAKLSDFNQKKVKPAVGAAVETAKSAATDPRVVETAKNAATKVGDVAGKVGVEAKTGAADAVKAAGDLIEENKPKVKATLRDIGGKVKEGGEKLLDTSKKGLGAAKELFAENAPKLKAVAGEAIEGAKVSADEIAAEVKRLSAKGGKASEEAIEKLLSTAKEEGPKALKTLRNMIDTGRAQLGETISDLSKRGLPKAAADVREAFRGIGAQAEEFTTRAEQAAAKLKSIAGIEVSGETPGPRSGPKPPPKPPVPASAAKQLVKGVGRFGGGLTAAATEAAFLPTDEIAPTFARATPAAPALALNDFTFRKARGEETIPALKATARDAFAPFTFGLLNNAEEAGLPKSPLDTAVDKGKQLSLVDRGLGQLGFGPTQAEFDAQNATLANEDVASTAAQAAGAGLPTPPQVATLRDAGIELPQGRGVTQGGAPAAQFEPESGTRDFDNLDARAAQAGIDPASRRGTASVEENQAVLNRLIARNQGLRAQQFAGSRAPAPTATGGQRQGTVAATRAAQSGGIASAFGALALSGNSLRRDAADRGRAAASAAAVQKSALDLRSKLTEIGAKSDIKKNENFAKDTIALGKSYNEALATGDQAQISTVKSGIYQGALRDPTGAAAANAAGILADDILKSTTTGFFEALISINPFTGGRGFSDALASAGQGKNIFQNFNNEFQDAINKMVLDTSTGKMYIASPDNSGNPQFVVNIADLPPESRNYVSQGGIRQVGPGQELTRGDPNLEDPRLSSL